ncbi:Thyroid transcription factor 1-associated protein 26 [Papilio machaon]|uniref:Thyroid transcription factor 1-associated protein 26 n=1 Tax=Papilio machaon TaxID=76193 RepID=A0A194QQU9_PAPMA|nr:Thyroid transcription factor 1-associated protein 26 [Papilio machaon]
MEKKQDSFFLRAKKPQGNNKKVDKQKTKPLEKDKEKRQNNYDTNRPVINDKKDVSEKKPFDKKAYRLKKYSKKYKLEQWEEKRKKKLLYDYHKSIKNDPLLGSYTPKSFDEDTIDSNPPEVGKFVRNPDLIEKEKATKLVQKTKKDPFQKAKEHYEKIKLEKLEKQKELQKSKEEKAQKLQEYKKKKQERYKKLSKKTKKGQPVMTGRLEMLLEKIQK